MSFLIGWRVCGGERVVQKLSPDADRTTKNSQSRRNPVLRLHHLREQSQVNRNDFVIMGQVIDGTVDKSILITIRRLGCWRQLTVTATKLDQYFSCVATIEQVDHHRVSTKLQWRFHGLHKAIQRQPEVVSNEHNALHPCPITLANRANQFGIRRIRMRVKPLFKLIQNNQQTAVSTDTTAATNLSKRFWQSTAGQVAAMSLNRCEQLFFREVCGRLQNDRDNLRFQQRHQPCSN